MVKLAFQRVGKHYLNVYKSCGPVSQRQAVLKADHENRVCSPGTHFCISMTLTEKLRARGGALKGEGEKTKRPLVKQGREI